MSSPVPSYTGTEQSFAWNGRMTASGGLFEVRPSDLPRTATPIYDDDLDCIIGYQCDVTGVIRTFDLDGRCVSVDEKPLEAPLFDPLDFVLIVGSLWRAGARGLARSGIHGVGAATARATIAGLRMRFAALSQRPLRFAATPLSHMQDPNRFVPAHILRLAIRHGKRTADPKGHPGVFQYTVPMTRRGVSYRLEVVVRERDYTVLHFVYRR